MPFWKSRRRVEITGQEARQGPLGSKVLVVLIVSLILGIVAWGGLEMWAMFKL